MKKILCTISLLTLIYLPSRVLAASINVQCPISATVGDTITCTVIGYHTSLAGLKASVNYSGMNYTGVNNLTGSNMFVVSNSVLDGAFDIASNSKSLASYTFKATTPGTAKLNITCEEIIDGTDFSSVSCTGASKSIVINKKTINEKPTTGSSNISKNDDATLKEIKLSIGNIQLLSEVYSYNIEVDYDVNIIEVNGILNDNKASLELVGDTNLQVGDNKLLLNVTAENGITKKTYTINILRNEKKISTNNKIKKLIVHNYIIDFDKTKKEYDLHIGNEEELTIDIELEDEYAKYEIIGNKELNNRSVIIIKVTAEDGSVNEYKINIIKEINLTNIFGISLIISIIINICLLIAVKKINKKYKSILY